ncbi:MAG TPA: UV DNA damage repair endonuclease UvsE [Gaiellaceae bacterium]|nr:UV DNA damage repair endonuclease UvsE [Gaiellaceae bacterium]
MPMRVGYACVNTRLPSASRTLRLARLTEERLRELVSANLDALEAILRWNLEHDLLVFRLSSETVPFGSHPANTLRWRDDLAGRFAELGALMREGGMRLSVHPGQFTVLGSPREDVAAASVAEVDYHARLLGAFGLDSSHKVVIHAGGRYGDPEAAAERFASAFGRLSPAARARLVLENDERWSLEEVLALAERLGVPVVFDAFHHELRPSLPELGVREAVLRAGETWSPADGRQEVHFSTQAPGRRPGAHADTLDLELFGRFAAAVGDLELDCVVEVKDKERSALLARQALAERSPSRPS